MTHTMKNTTLTNNEISKLTGADFIEMLTPEEKCNFLMELNAKGETFDELANKQYKNFKYFVTGSFHWRSGIKGLMYWNGVANKFDK